MRREACLRHLWLNTHFPWHSDGWGSTLAEHGGILSHVVTQWHYVVSKIYFGRFFWLIVRREGCLRHFWHNTHFPWHSHRRGSRLGERGDILIYFKTPWHDVVSGIHFFGRFVPAVRAAGFLRHVWHKTYFLALSDRRGTRLYDGNTTDINNC